GVRRRNDVRAPALRGVLEKFAAQCAQPRFTRESAPLHAPERVPSRRDERHIEAPAEIRDERLVYIRRRSSQPMVEMRRDDVELELALERVQRKKQSRRIRAAAHSDEHAAPRANATRARESPADRGLQTSQAHADPGEEWWRRRDLNPRHRDYDSP